MTNTTNKTVITNAEIGYFLAELLDDVTNARAAMLQFLVQSFYELRIPKDRQPEVQSWGLVDIGNGGFYLYPLFEKCYLVYIGNFSIGIDHHQLGMAVTLDVLSLISRESHDPDIEKAYQVLRDYIVTQGEKLEGALTYARLTDSL